MFLTGLDLLRIRSLYNLFMILVLFRLGKLITERYLFVEASQENKSSLQIPCFLS